MTSNPPEFTAAIAERTVVVTWPDNDRGGAMPPPDGWQERAWATERTLHEIDEGSVSGCSVLRWRNDPRSDTELIAASLALVTGKPAAPAVFPEPPSRAAWADAADAIEAERDRRTAAEVGRFGSADHESTLQAEAFTDAADLLRRLAAEAQQQPETEAPTLAQLVEADADYRDLLVRRGRELAAPVEPAAADSEETPRRCDCPNEDAVEHQFGTEDCTCVPFTRQTNPPRYLNRPTDTVDMISGWERGADCPHHRPAEPPV